jgi:hypothetical protein
MAKANGQLGAAIKAEELRGKLRGFYVDMVEHGTGSNPNDRGRVASVALGLDRPRLPARRVALTGKSIEGSLGYVREIRVAKASNRRRPMRPPAKSTF